jgi:hypothetical protein
MIAFYLKHFPLSASLLSPDLNVVAKTFEKHKSRICLLSHIFFLWEIMRENMFKVFSLPNRLFFMLASVKKSIFFLLKLLFFTLDYFFSRWKKSPDKQDLDI